MRRYLISENVDNSGRPLRHTYFTGLHTQKAHTHSGTSSTQCVHQICSCIYSLSPPGQVARWALMRRLLSVCLSVCLGVLRAHYTPLQRYVTQYLTFMEIVAN